MLSIDNYNKIIKTGLYKKEPPKDYYNDVYWCKNWSFKPKFSDSGKIYMCDTYFNNWENAIELTDKNFKEFEFVFDFELVKKISDSESDEYEKEDLFRIATNSGGYSCGNLYWVKKDAVKSNQKLIKKTLDRINFLKNEIEYEERRLKRLKQEESPPV